MDAKLLARPWMDADATLRVAADKDGQTLTGPSKVINCTQCMCIMNTDFQFRFWNQLTIL